MRASTADMLRRTEAVPGSTDSQRTILHHLVEGVESAGVSDLCRDTGLSRPTVVSSLAALEAAGLVEQSGEPASTPRGGRPSRRVRASHQRRLVLSVVLRRRGIEVSLHDPRMTPLIEPALRRCLVGELDHPGRDVLHFARETLASHGYELADLAVVVVGVIGIVSGSREVTVSYALPNIVGDALFAELKEAIPHAHVLIENDANLATLDEAWDAVPEGTLAGLLIGPDVGCGIVINRAIHRGHHGAAGELRSRSWDRAFRRIQRSEPGEPTDALFRRAALGEAGAVEFARDLAKDISDGLATVIEVLDPTAVAIGGDAVVAAHLMADLLTEELTQRLGWFSTTILVPRAHTFAIGEGAALLGAEWVRQNCYRLPGD